MLIDPIAFHIPFIDWPVRWYGMVYAFGALLTAFWMPSLLIKRGVKIARKKEAGQITRDEVWDLVFWVFLGVVLGARLGWWLFYHPGLIFSDPLQILQVWEGGMSIHGGIIGGVVAGILGARKYKIPVLKIADAIVVPISLTLIFGRIANFINGELVGRVTDLGIGMNFPGYEGLRHPSQLYESFGHLVLLVIFLPLVLKNKKWGDGAIFALWMVIYGLLRFTVEFFRAPDWLFAGLSAGQWLSVGLIIAGRILWAVTRTSSRLQVTSN